MSRMFLKWLEVEFVKDNPEKSYQDYAIGYFQKASGYWYQWAAGADFLLDEDGEAAELNWERSATNIRIHPTSQPTAEELAELEEWDVVDRDKIIESVPSPDDLPVDYQEFPDRKNTPEELADEFKDRPIYDPAVKAGLDQISWDGVFPVVRMDGTLTGFVYWLGARKDDYDIVDVREEGGRLYFQKDGSDCAVEEDSWNECVKHGNPEEVERLMRDENGEWWAYQC